MKTTITLLAVLFCWNLAFSQEQEYTEAYIHEQIELLLDSKNLAQFEIDIEASDLDKNNPEVVAYYEKAYQDFVITEKQKVQINGTAEPLEFELNYQALVDQVKIGIGKIPVNSVPKNGLKAANGPCVNMDFETGDFTGWTLTRGDVTGAAPFSFANEVAQAPGTYHTIFSGGVDPIVGIPTVNPDGGSFSVQLGDAHFVGARAARMKQTFLVDATNSIFTYSYAVVFQSPVGHASNQQPYFSVRVYDSLGQNINCGEYSVVADASTASSYSSVTVGLTTTLYKDWETVFANLTPYIGQNVTVEFTAGDCSLSGHYGYAYVDASCMSNDIFASNPLVCTGDSAVLDAPDGAHSYLWNTGDTTESITIFNGGVYTVEMIPEQGAACSVNATITIGDSHSPVTDFNSTASACVNDSVSFTDATTINPTGTIDSYQWDFGDGVVTTPGMGTLPATTGTSGTYLAPTHLYTTAGTYTISLTVTTVDGCIDVMTRDITINPLPALVGGTDVELCNDGSQVTLTATGANSYAWSFGITNGVPFTQSVGSLNYVVVGTSVDGCINRDTVNVTIHALPNVSAGGDVVVCENTSVTLSGSGAVNYTWDNSINDGVPFIQNVGQTDYIVEGTDAFGCQNKDTVSVLVNALPTVFAGTDQEVCEGQQVTLTANGGITATWDNGVLDGVAFTPPVGQNIYVLTGTDVNSCFSTDTVMVTVNALPNISAGNDINTCNGVQTVLTGSGGVTYSWSGSVTNGVPFVSAPGIQNYVVTGTDGNGCVNTDTVEVNSNTPIQVDAGPVQEACFGDQVTLNGSGAVTYAWNNGVVDGVPFTPPLGLSTYTVTGTDINGCQSSDNVDVVVHALPSVSAGNDQDICFGGVASLNASGANTYVWDNGVLDGVNFNPPAGSTDYIVTGTDLNGCVNTDTVNVFVHNLPTVDAGNDQTVCPSSLITLTATGATTYSWNFGVSNGAGFIQTVNSVDYIVTGTDGNGCVNTDTVNVSLFAKPVVIGGNDQIVCLNDMVTLSGAGALNYSWSGGVTNGVAFTPPLGTTDYIVTGTDGNGCMNTDTVNVLVNPLPMINAGNDQGVCEGTQIVLNAVASSPYVWSNGVVDNVPFSQTVGTVFYVATATDLNGCVFSDTVEVMVDAFPTVNAGNDIDICFGNQTTLNATGAVTYVWDNGVTNGVAFTPISGDYIVTGSSLNGCQNKDTVSINVLSLPSISAGLDQEVCVGSTVTLNGSGGVTYTWDNGVVDGVAFIPPVGQNDYIVTGAGANGCTLNDTVTVTVHDLPSVSAGNDQMACLGDTISLTGSGANTYAWDNGVVDGVGFVQTMGSTTYIVTGTDVNGCVNLDTVDVMINGLPNVTAPNDSTLCPNVSFTATAIGATNYSWTGGITNGVPFVPSTGGTEYIVTGTDANGCRNIDTMVITVNPIIVPFTIPNQEVCDGDTVVLTGSGNLTYAWNNGVVDGVGFVPSVGTTDYISIGTDIHNCTVVDTVTVVVNNLPVVSAGNDQLLCEGSTVNLAGSGAVSYTWDNGVVDGVDFQQGITSQDYIVIGTDANGCVNSDTVNVDVLPNPVVDAGQNLEACFGTSFTLNASGANTYVWDNNVFDGTPFQQAVGTIIYHVTGTDGNGCQGTDSLMAIVHAIPVVQAGTDQGVCDGFEVTLNAIGSTNLSWNNNVSNNVPFIQGVGIQEYIVTDVNGFGCVGTDTVQVEVFSLPTISASDIEICDGDQAILNGQGGVSYTWSSNVFDGQPFYPSSTSSSYIVIGEDANGCIGTDTATVTVRPLPVVDFVILNTDLSTNSSVSGFVNNTTGAVSYDWDFGDGQSDTEFEPIHTFPTNQAGSYMITLTATSQYGCIGTQIQSVDVEQDFTLFVPNAFSPNGDEINQVFKPISDGLSLSQYEFSVYNRWGEAVYTTNSIKEGWDGTHRGQSSQDGVYVWKIIATVQGTADKRVFTGHVNLIK